MLLGIRVKQAVKMHHHIFHLGIVNSALRRRPPRFFGACIIGEDADHIDLGQIFELKRHRILDPATHNQMHFTHELPFQLSKGSR